MERSCQLLSPVSDHVLNVTDKLDFKELAGNLAPARSADLWHGNRADVAAWLDIARQRCRGSIEPPLPHGSGNKTAELGYFSIFIQGQRLHSLLFHFVVTNEINRRKCSVGWHCFSCASRSCHGDVFENASAAKLMSGSALQASSRLNGLGDDSYRPCIFVVDA